MCIEDDKSEGGGLFCIFFRIQMSTTEATLMRIINIANLNQKHKKRGERGRKKGVESSSSGHTNATKVFKMRYSLRRLITQVKKTKQRNEANNGSL